MERTTGRDDEALIERLRKDDREVMAVLYDTYGRQAFGLAYRLLGEPNEAEDVVQESFLSLWRQAGQVDASRGSVRSLLLTIVHRRAIDALRRRSGRPQIALEQAELVPGALPDPADVASASESRESILRALGGLPEEQRQAIELTYFGGLTVAEMAEKQGIPVGTAKSRLRLALERMRKTMSGASE